MLKNGSTIKFKPEYISNSDELFKVSQWDENRQRGWAGDENGFGWYFSANQVVEVEEDEDDDENEFLHEDDPDEDDLDEEYGYSTQKNFD